MAQNILRSGGLLVSEQPGTKPALPHHFLLRNRIIAGLSLGTVVVEAANKSGALVTANYALESDRVVFAVPGDVDRAASVGTNRLIRQGAVLVRAGKDILEELGPQLTGQIQLLLKTEQDVVLAARKPKTMTDLMTVAKMAQKDLIPLLTRLELDGSLSQQPDGTYVAAR
jgi:DNA processing protein